MSGYLEQFNSNAISGWVHLDGSSNILRLVFNGNETVQLPANIERADLPGGARGFIFELPDRLKQIHPLTVECIAPNGKPVANSPRNIETRKSEIKKVLTGRDGWYFLANDSNSNIDYLTGKRVLDSRTVDNWNTLIDQRIERFSRAGIPFIQIVVAEKEVVYQDMLPDGYLISEERPIMHILRHLSASGSAGSFLYGPLKKQEGGSDTTPIYFKGDTHFTFHGAKKLTGDLLVRFNSEYGIDFSEPLIELAKYRYCKRFQAGDLLAKLPRVNIEEIDYPITRHKHYVLLATKEARSGRIKAISNPAGSGRLLAFHTSSIDWMAPYLNDVFRDVLYIWGGAIDEGLLSWFKPDYVIAQTNERFLTSCPQDTHV